MYFYSISQELDTANATILSLQSELEMRERLYQDLRETKERELTELKKINSDLEVSIHKSLIWWESPGALVTQTSHATVCDVCFVSRHSYTVHSSVMTGHRLTWTLPALSGVAHSTSTKVCVCLCVGTRSFGAGLVCIIIHHLK